ncbi:RNA ligase family protein [Paenibacillus aurantius]|uniref:RNA ligase family protein n=1 Tax=Paenibacillus aurantius TaxID=2918900 RepID=A0AA96L9G1_9BACL|nr:RNA ligase family protein [Paenibacillus aurantius]WNQ09579.1 RNA ligase family protein [Paenibacillus aurantius]
MLLETGDQPFNDDRYLFEPKIDGHRLILSHRNGQTKLYTRYQNECTRQYPELLRVPTNDDVILDGEVACIDPDTGEICLESVMERFRTTKQTKIQYAYKTQPVHFVAFDILSHNGRDLRRLPLAERKVILNEVLEDNHYFSKSMVVDGRGTELFRLIQERNMEGIVAKRKDSIYVSKRSNQWVKIINWQYADVYIAGYRRKEFGWLAAVPTADGQMRTAGVIELGVTPEQKRAFYGVCKHLVIGEDNHFVHLDPRIRAKVKIRNWTRSGMLRSPAFVEFAL